MIIRKFSTIVFVDNNGRLLLQDRKNISKFGEHWGFFGGKIKVGEGSSTALIREIKEELNYELKKAKLLGFYKHILDQYTIHLDYVHVAVFPGFEHLKLQEGDGMKLFTLRQAKRLRMVPIYKKILPDLEVYLKNLKNYKNLL